MKKRRTGEKMKRNIEKKSKTKNLNTLEYRFVTYSDLGQRLLSFLLDVCVMISPIAIWNIILLSVLGSLLSINGIIIINMTIAVFMIISVFLFNSFILTRTKGRSLGMQLFGYKIISNGGKPANQHQIRLRELVGFDIPFVLLMVFTNIFGVAAYWLINGLVSLLDPKHRSLIDFITRTCVVVVGKVEQSEVELVREQPVAKKQEALPLNSLDLHVHSNFSANGEYNVEDIFQYARKHNIRYLSITDLDTAKSNVLATRMSELYGIFYIPGIEINCQLHGKRVRVLGYFIDYNSDIFATIENDSLLAEKTASIERVQKFEQLLGLKIDIPFLLKNNRFQKIPGDMIADYVLKRPAFHDCDLLKPFLKQGLEHPERLLSKAYFAYGKPCYVPVKYPDVKDVIDVISLTNGISVLAHPGKLLNQSPNFMMEVIKLGIQGVEVFHPMHTRSEMVELLKIAKEYKLFVTCGSGFYRQDRSIQIGQCACPPEAETLVDMFLKTKM